jgi:hypothetical protein
MGNHEPARLAAPLWRRVADDADAAEIAEAMVMTWREIDAVLTPIIGQLGLAALYKRSLYLTGTGHPWLTTAHDGTQPGIDLATLKLVFTRQLSRETAVAGEALLRTFDTLLASLVGPSLTERLLHPVWNHAAPGPGSPEKDTFP